MMRGYSLRKGKLTIAGRVVARNVKQAKRIFDRRKNRTLIAALISYDMMTSRNIIAFTQTGRRVWQIAEPMDAPRGERVFVGLHGSTLRPIATTYAGWVYDINGSDGSLWYLKWVK